VIRVAEDSRAGTSQCQRCDSSRSLTSSGSTLLSSRPHTPSKTFTEAPKMEDNIVRVVVSL
jgi:hypothetical protein